MKMNDSEKQKRTNIMIDDARKAQAQELGNGNFSAGIRKALDLVAEFEKLKGESLEKTISDMKSIS